VHPLGWFGAGPLVVAALLLLGEATPVCRNHRGTPRNSGLPLPGRALERHDPVSAFGRRQARRHVSARARGAPRDRWRRGDRARAPLTTTPADHRRRRIGRLCRTTGAAEVRRRVDNGADRRLPPVNVDDGGSMSSTATQGRPPIRSHGLVVVSEASERPLGHLVFYSIPEEHIPNAALVEEWLARGLERDLLSRPPTGLGTFRAALPGARAPARGPARRGGAPGRARGPSGTAVQACSMFPRDAGDRDRAGAYRARSSLGRTIGAFRRR
jgi:hypothetical protein